MTRHHQNHDNDAARGRVRIPADIERPDRILARLGLDEDGLVRTVREGLADLQHPSELRSPVDQPLAGDTSD